MNFLLHGSTSRTIASICFESKEPREPTHEVSRGKPNTSICKHLCLELSEPLSPYSRSLSSLPFSSLSLLSFCQSGCKRFQGSLRSPRVCGCSEMQQKRRGGPKDTTRSVFLGSLFRSGTTSWRGGGPHCRTSSRRLSSATKGREKQHRRHAEGRYEAKRGAYPNPLSLPSARAFSLPPPYCPVSPLPGTLLGVPCSLTFAPISANLTLEPLPFVTSQCRPRWRDARPTLRGFSRVFLDTSPRLDRSAVSESFFLGFVFFVSFFFFFFEDEWGFVDSGSGLH